MSDASKLLRTYIERPMSVTADAAIAIGIGAMAHVLLGLVPSGDGLWGGIRAGLSGVVAAIVYMRARTNLINPAPVFK